MPRERTRRRSRVRSTRRTSPTSGPAPALEAKGWINSPPLTPSALTGKVVLYDIWTYSCINCVRTFPYVRAWYDRYRADGLVVVGVHSPEFDFEKVHGNVEDAVKRLNVTWPVALDDDLTIWNAFDNQYWPADYVADRTGELRYSHFGEGDYTNTENVLRTLLGVAPSSPRATAGDEAGDRVGQAREPRDVPRRRSRSGRTIRRARLSRRPARCLRRRPRSKGPGTATPRRSRPPRRARRSRSACTRSRSTWCWRPRPGNRWTRS